MLCCRPKKDKYNLEEAENNDSDKKTKPKDSKKSKNQGELSETNMGNSQGKKKNQAENTVSESKKDNVESEGKPNNAIASAEVESNKDQTVKGHNDENKTVPGDTEMKLVEETVTKTNVEKEESAIGGVGESNLDKVVDKDKARIEFFRDVYTPKEKVKDQTKSKAVTDQDQTGSKSATNTDSTAKPDRKSASADTGQPVAGDPEHTAKTEKQPVASVDPEQLASEDSDQVMSAVEMQAAITRLEAVAVRLESLAQTTGTTTSGGGGGGGSGAAAPDVLSPSVLAYDDLTKGKFAEYLDLSSKIGGDVQAQAEMVKAGFQAVKDFLIIASKSKKPSQNDLVELLKPISNQITAVQDFRETKRGGKMFNHLSGISESLPALGWVSVEPTPGPYVKEMADAGMFFTNRVVKEFKETEPMHVDWTKAWLGTLRELQAYIKEHHTTGVTWNPQGGDAKSASVAKPPPPPSAGGPPPPPPPGPPPPPPPAMDLGEPSDGAPDARAALFADLNKGEGVTAGLKKVTDDMKTHKNPALRGSSQVSGVRAGPAPFKAPSGPKTAPKPNKVAAPAAAKPPVLELQQKKWVVEYQIGNKTMVIDQTNIKQTVYMYKCENSTLQIKGKVNSITLDTCKKVAIAFDDVVSSIEFVNCQSIQAQVIGKCPTVSIDKTDGCLMYLSKDSLDAEIVTAKSSEMNLLVPKDDGDFEEFPLPEQYKTKWNGKKFITGVADSI